MLGRQPAGANAEAGNLQAPPIAALFLVKFDKKEGYAVFIDYSFLRYMSRNWLLNSRYKITWKRSTRDSEIYTTFFRTKLHRWLFYFRILIVQLDGVVEYKSLPSGLHNLDDDIM